MDIERSVERDVLVLRLSGELDLVAAPVLKRTMERELLGTKVQSVVLNMSGVTFVDSSGIGVLLGRYKEVTQAGGQLVLANLRPHVQTVLELSGLNRVIAFAGSESEALELVSAGRGQGRA